MTDFKNMRIGVGNFVGSIQGSAQEKGGDEIVKQASVFTEPSSLEFKEAFQKYEEDLKNHKKDKSLSVSDLLLKDNKREEESELDSLMTSWVNMLHSCTNDAECDVAARQIESGPYPDEWAKSMYALLEKKRAALSLK